MRLWKVLGALASVQVVIAAPARSQTARSQSAHSQEPRIAIDPRQPSGGSLVRLTIDRLPRSGDSVSSISGEMAGEPLHFRAMAAGQFRALGAIPLSPSDSVVARVRVVRTSGAIDTLRLFLKFAHQAPPPPVAAARPAKWTRAATARRLTVDRRFTQALDSATSARVEDENEQARAVGRRAQATPQLWTFPFLRPRTTKVTSQFGSGRLFNGRVSSSHLGIDYRGAVGEPIYASNRGVVALVGEFFLAGNVVYVDHGNGIVTAYFHMSKPEVVIGDTVERGQEIGLVGATGRVTGPHLHWSARFGALTIDPGDLLTLATPFVARDTTAVQAAKHKATPVRKKR